jgi:peptidoglycan/LPS O-acetylase OafA/YrhL
MKPSDGAIAESIVRPRMPELDTLRGIAILAVFLFHGFGAMVWSTLARPVWERLIIAVARVGWAGVNLFFVLSGFLITGILLDSLHKPAYYRRFYSRRARRILPAYYLMLLVMIVWNYSTGVSRRDTWEFAGLSFIYLSNMAVLFGVSTLYPLLWSLSVEEHFYLIWPTVIRLFSRRGVTLLAALICIIEPALRLYALAAGTEPWWAGPHHGGAYTYTWMSADGLALGALLALLARSARGSRDNFRRLALIALAVSLVATGVSVLLPQAISVWLRGTLVNYYSLAMVTAALWLGTGAHRAWVNIRLLSFYGFISYGLYLVHGWIFGVYDTVLRRFAPELLPNGNFPRLCLEVVVCAVVATTVAYLSRVTYEEFFLRANNKANSADRKIGAAVTA